MTMQDVAATVVPGWYADPTGEALRWWDGKGWTDHTAARPSTDTVETRATSTGGSAAAGEDQGSGETMSGEVVSADPAPLTRRQARNARPAGSAPLTRREARMERAGSDAAAAAVAAAAAAAAASEGGAEPEQVAEPEPIEQLPPAESEPIEQAPPAAASDDTAKRPLFGPLPDLPNDLITDGRLWPSVPATPLPVTGWNNCFVWLVACTPFVAAVTVSVILFLSLGGELPVWAAALNLLPVAWCVTFALEDRKVLVRNGLTRPTSPWWLLLGIVLFLGLRALRIRSEGGRSASPFWVYLGNATVAGSIVLGAAITAVMNAVASSAIG